METEKSWEKTHREKSCQLESGLVQWGNEQIFSLENNYETEGKYFLKDLGFWKLTKSNWEIEKHLFIHEKTSEIWLEQWEPVALLPGAAHIPRAWSWG